MKTTLRLLPILLIYAVIILAYVLEGHSLRVDENRYVAVAQSLAEGRYSSEGRLQLWSGPGYPLILTPFARFGVSWDLARLLNAGILFLAVVYFQRALSLYVSPGAACAGSYVLGLYPPIFELIPRLMTEPLAVFLICGFIYHFCMTWRGGRRYLGHLVAASLYLGYLALTRVIFGYVIAVTALVFLGLLVLRRRRAYLRSATIAGLAVVVCLPYLAHTHSLTGRIFYWANSGGLSLYWMSSPYKGEYGDYLGPTAIWLRHAADAPDPGRADKHREFLDQVHKLDLVERDDALKRQAFANIRSHPGKFARNWLANVSRLFLNYPFSHLDQTPSTLLYALPGTLLLVACLLCIYPTWAGRASFPPDLSGVGVVGLVYLGGSTVLSAYGRMLLPVLPILIGWVTLTLSRAVRLDVAWRAREND